MVESEVSVVRYDCDGNTNQYSFLFPIVTSEDLVVIIYDTESQYEAVLKEGEHYTVTPATGGFGYGGTVTIQKWDDDTQSYEPFYFANTVRITLLREPKSLQLSEYKNNEVLPKHQLENDMDRIYYHLQRLYEKFKHILFSSPSDPNELELPPAETRANHALAFDSEGKPVAGETIITPVSDYMAGFLQSANWDDLEDNGFFEQALTYEKIKEGFSSVDQGYTTDPSGFAPNLSVINTLKTIDLTWDALPLLTNLDHFEVERSELNGTSGFTKIAETPRERTIFIDAPDYNYVDGVPIPKTYWYRVVGKTHTGGLTAYSNTIEVTVYPVGLQDIEANAIIAVHIQSESVSSRHIQSNSITADKLSAGAISADSIDVGKLLNTAYTHIDGGAPGEALGEIYDGGAPGDPSSDTYNDYTKFYEGVEVDSVFFENSIYTIRNISGTDATLTGNLEADSKVTANGNLETTSGDVVIGSAIIRYNSTSNSIEFIV